ncbi:MAG: hypothetical protein NUV91_08375 [Candidatus Omnitrophica bacterium]|nr:hypothetical protein [Candidatus Omnitrophota bacterium]
MRNFKNRLKTKWAISSDRDFWIIMLVFSLAGMMISVCRKPLFHVIGITPQTHLWVKILIYPLFFIPTYQFFLMLFGTLLGQFSFFWEKEKRMGRWILQKIQSIFLARLQNN